MRILLVEDDRELSRAIEVHLKAQGYAVTSCYSGDTALQRAADTAPDLVLLDWMLPGMDGLQLLYALRKAGVSSPVLMVTARNGVSDRVGGLDAGADDYLVKPFAMEELLARVRALSRRPQRMEEGEALRFGDLRFWPTQLRLTGPSGECSLSRREAGLMEALLRGGQQTLSRAALFTRVWGGDTPVESGNLDTYIHFLRRRLKAVGSSVAIKTIHAVGYRLTEPPC